MGTLANADWMLHFHRQYYLLHWIKTLLLYKPEIVSNKSKRMIWASSFTKIFSLFVGWKDHLRVSLSHCLDVCITMSFLVNKKVNLGFSYTNEMTNFGMWVIGHKYYLFGLSSPNVHRSINTSYSNRE